MARRLLTESEADPELIRRSGVQSPIAPKLRGVQPFSAMALLAEPALDVRQYLEDLAEIAISSAQQAEELAAETQAANRKARRSMMVLAGFGAFGLLVGMVGFAVGRSSNVLLAEMRQEMGALHEMQRQTQDQLSDLATQNADQRDAAEQHQVPEQRDVGAEASRSVATAPAVAAVQPPPSTTTTPQARQPATASFYYQPWPDSRPAVRRAPALRSQSTQPVVVPRFFAEIQRGVRGIFR
ncbi:MAG TPA: hypothetical protein VFL55_15270 [Acetobacteraceae bacterium]|nr:hypothetical protein [Acetobacteraceae bacterium]